MNYKSKKFTSLHRFLHWSTALLMTVLFITGFLRMKWMGKRSIKAAIEQNMLNANYTEDEAIAVAKTILKPMWQWHEYAAYIIFLILAIRTVYMLIKGMRFPNPFSLKCTLKERFQGIIYLLFYLFVIVSSITGAYLKWWKGDLKEPLEAIHKWGIYWFPIFIAIHFVGIWLAEKFEQKGITSKMIGGDN